MKAVPISRYLVFLLIAAGGCLVDLATKSWAFDRLGMPTGRKEWIWEGVVGLETSLNRGALFGLGQGWVTTLAILSVVAAAAVCCWLFLAGAARQWLLTLSLSCVTAGILGNLYDRLGLPGLTWHGTEPGVFVKGEPVHAVRDWILVMIGSYHWPNFNIADSLLVCGAATLLWHAYRTGPEERESEEAKPQ